MDKSISSFQLMDYSVDAIEFTVNPDFKQSGRIKLDFDIDSDVALLDEEEKITKVVLACTVFKNYRRANKPFRLKVSISGLFKFSGDASQDQLMKFSEINATAVLFPYLRAVITHVTSASNKTPLLLPLINVYEFIEIKKRKVADANAQQ